MVQESTTFEITVVDLAPAEDAPVWFPGVSTLKRPLTIENPHLRLGNQRVFLGGRFSFCSPHNTYPPIPLILLR